MTPARSRPFPRALGAGSFPTELRAPDRVDQLAVGTGTIRLLRLEHPRQQCPRRGARLDPLVALRRGLLLVLPELRERTTPEGLVPGQREVQHAPEAVDVGAVIDIVRRVELLGRHGDRRPHHLTCDGELEGLVQAPGETEIHELGAGRASTPSRLEEDVLGLHVSVDEALDLFVSVLETPGRVEDDRQGVRLLERAVVLDVVAEVHAVNELEDHEAPVPLGHAGLVDGDDVGMLQLREVLRSRRKRPTSWLN